MYHIMLILQNQELCSTDSWRLALNIHTKSWVGYSVLLSTWWRILCFCMFPLLSVILETLIPVARQTNNSSNLMMTCFGCEANAESFQVLHGRLWKSMDVWDKLRQCISEIFACRLFVTLPIHEMLSQALAENSGIISLMGPVYMAWETQAVKQVVKLSLVKRITRPY